MGEAGSLVRLFGAVLLISFVLGGGVEEEPSVGAAAPGTVRLLPGIHDVTHAVAAPEAERLLLLSDETLWVVDPEGPEAEPIELPAAVCGLAVHGRRAAVRHDGFLTLIDLTSRALERILEVHLPCGEVVLSEDYAYLLTQRLNRQQVMQIPLAGGPLQATDVSFFSVGCRLAHHPSGEKIYVACNDTIGRIGLDAEGRVDAEASFEIRVDGGLGCNRMWVTRDGRWAYAACGGRLRSGPGMPRRMFPQVLAASRRSDDLQDVDLSPSGRLPMQGIRSACETGSALAVIPAQFSPYQVHNGHGWDNPHLLDEHAGRSLEIFSHPQLRPLASLPVPSFPSGDTARGQAVVCGLRDGRVHVLVEGDGAGDWGLWTVVLPR